jgi:Common central domain of tyrosinase/von Willebrand factor type A domain
MALGDGIRRNIAHVEPSERALFRDAFLELNRRFFPGSRTDSPPGGVTWWFKQDEIHQATHVHGTPEFVPWHRELVNRLEEMLRQINPQLSLHYWDWTQDPRSIPDGNLGGGTTGTLSLFTPDFMGYGGTSSDAIGPPWQNAAAPWRSDGFYVPGASPDRDSSGNPADPPDTVSRFVDGSPASASDDNGVVTAGDYPTMWARLKIVHDAMHGFVAMGGAHISFRDPFVFLLHSNVDRLFAMWQTAPGHPERLDPSTVYGSDGISPSVLDNTIRPWNGTPPTTRPWAPPENEQVVKTYKHASVVRPPCYDTLPIFPPSVTLETPSVNFNDVPEGETAARAIVFSAISCGAVHLSITAGPSVISGPAGTSFGTFPTLGTSVPIPHISSSTPPRGRLWLSYKGTSAGDVATGTVTVHCAETNQDFVVPIAANTIARPTVATMLVLDQSGSMYWLAGIDATTKRIDVLHQAAATFVQLLQRYVGDAVGMVSFDHNTYPGAPVTQYTGGPFDLLTVQNAIQALSPQGATSIGGGVALGRNTLNPVTGYDHKALIVFTDGLENTAPYIADVMSSVNDRTFAIGLGTAQQVSTAALNALTNSTGGYLLLSGILSPSIDDTFRLAKYFLQILAGVTNNNIVTDPAGFLAPGMKARIPFQLNETDIDATPILLTDLPVVRLLIETPDGDVMDPATAAGLGAAYETAGDVSFYRFTLPLPLGAAPAQSGTWHALLEIDPKVYKRLTHRSEESVAAWSARAAHGVRYCVTVQSYSNLRMEARLTQDSMVPGATMRLRATLSEYGIPVANRAAVRADVERPDGTHTTLTLAEIEDGIFEASIGASIEGVYRFHLSATGMTLRGLPFTRDRLITGAVFLGGNNPWPTSDPSRDDVQTRICDLLECLLDEGTLGRFFAQNDIDADALRRCVERWCKERRDLSDEEVREREGIGTARQAEAVPPAALSPQVLETLTRLMETRQPSPDMDLKEERPKPEKEC